MTGSLLRSGKLTDYRALGDAGQKVYSAAAQIRQAVKYKVGEEAPDYLAIPQINDKGDTIDWYAPEPGDVIPWSSATTEEQSSARDKLENAQQKLIETAKRIQQDEQTDNQVDQQLFARLLDKVIHFPSPEHVYIVNGKPVLTFWGFSSHEQSTDNPLDWLRPAVASAPATAAAVEPAVPERGFRWWLLLPLLLLLLLTLWLLRGCWDQSAQENQPLPFEQTDNQPLPEDAEPIRNSVREGREGRDILVDRPVGTRFVEGQVEGQEGVIFGPDGEPTAVTEQGSEQIPEQIEDPLLDQALQQDQTQDMLQEAGEVGADALDEQQLADQQRSDQEADPTAGSGDTEPLSDNTQTPNGEQLSIPDSAQQMGSTGFLNGGWRSNSGLQETRSGVPMKIAYQFNDGQGKVRIYGGGLECEGDTSAQMNDGSLTINSVPVTCSDGSTGYAPQVICEPGDGNTANCTGSYEGGEQFPVRMNKSQ